MTVIDCPNCGNDMEVNERRAWQCAECGYEEIRGDEEEYVYTEEAEAAENMLTEDQGVLAIIALQKMTGIGESEERARAAWRSFHEWEKEATMKAHHLFCGGFKVEGEDEQ